MSALGQKQTSDCCPLMSTLPPKSGHRSARWQCPLCAKSRHLRVRAHQKKTSERCPQRCSGRLFTMSDEDFVDHVEHANSKLLWHWREPWRGVQSRPGVGEP